MSWERRDRNKGLAFSWRTFNSLLSDCPRLRSLYFQMMPPRTRPLFSSVDAEGSVEKHLRQFLEAVLCSSKAKGMEITTLGIDIYNSTKTLEDMDLLRTAQMVLANCICVRLEGQTNFWQAILSGPHLPSYQFPRLQSLALADSRIDTCNLIMFLQNHLLPGTTVLLHQVYLDQSLTGYSAEGEASELAQRLGEWKRTMEKSRYSIAAWTAADIVS